MGPNTSAINAPTEGEARPFRRERQTYPDRETRESSDNGGGQNRKPRTLLLSTGLATGGPPVLQARPVALIPQPANNPGPSAS